jgi:aminomethyltransferase
LTSLLAKTTPLYKICQQSGASFTEFAGWSMPLQFSSILQEVTTVRNQAGLFDVSHMGQLSVSGLEATPFLNQMLTNDIAKTLDGQVSYSPLCSTDGGTVDDLLIYRFNKEEYLLVVNAINVQTVLNFLRSHASRFKVELKDYSTRFALLALQGPVAPDILDALFPETILTLKPFRFSRYLWHQQECIISRTGYTGEDGFELYITPTLAESLWLELMQVGSAYGLRPAGLGARDVLRLEAGLPLYGHELSAQISPVQAGLERFIAWEKACFSGRSALLQEKDDPKTPRRIGLIADRSGIPRPGTTVYWEDQAIGQISSGTFSPTLQKGLGMAIVSPVPPPGTQLSLSLRGRFCPTACVQLPFYKRKR